MRNGGYGDAIFPGRKVIDLFLLKSQTDVSVRFQYRAVILSI